MKYIIELCAIPHANESLESRHEIVKHALIESSLPFNKDLLGLKVPEFGKSEFVVLSLSKFLPRGISCDIMYAYRGLSTNIDSDDRVFIELAPKYLDTNTFIKKTFPSFIELLDPYVLRFYNEEIMFRDFAGSRHKDSRKDIWRFYPAFYLSDQVLACNYNVGLLKIFHGLREEFPELIAEVINNGLYVSSPKLDLDVEESEVFDSQMRRFFASI